ncbi:hypothetical protein PFNF135_01842 [Plasmodium falciparum NF135/5.C10]|uniref:NELF-A N-terminal domain-containing protein n=1 Tax=Plasmodium falciparum NF135/5.C10 TaxID=1036726 RepID=W4IJ36_PLAFA|nr:hypothetical protein PFNF135_01842 [Plasmodium falciparum NF135/5.C10]
MEDDENNIKGCYDMNGSNDKVEDNVRQNEGEKNNMNELKEESNIINEEKMKEISDKYIKYLECIKNNWSSSQASKLLNKNLIKYISQRFLYMSSSLKVRVLTSFFYIPDKLRKESEPYLLLISSSAEIDGNGWVKKFSRILKPYIKTGVIDIKEIDSQTMHHIIQQVYKKHPNYISYIITCKESELFDNIEDAKDNKNVFHTNPFFVFITFLVFIIKYIHCDIIIVDSNKDIQGFDPNSVLNLSENVFNIFLDTKTNNSDIKTVYSSIFSNSKVTIDGTCSSMKELIKGRSLKYLDELGTEEYVNSDDVFNFSIFVYTVNGQPDIIQQVYKKHPNYISYIITCKESELFDNIEDAKDNKNVFHTNPNILSQLMIVFLIFFFLFIGFYVLINISTPKIYEEKQLIINKEH